MKPIKCERCKMPLGELAKDTKIRKGTVHLCAKCGQLIIAEAFGRGGQRHRSIFEEVFGRG